jgi:hypothetical protein
MPDQFEGPIDPLCGTDRLVDRDIKLGSFAVRVEGVREPVGMAGLEIAELLPITVPLAIRAVDSDVIRLIVERDHCEALLVGHCRSRKQGSGTQDNETGHQKAVSQHEIPPENSRRRRLPTLDAPY